MSSEPLEVGGAPAVWRRSRPKPEQAESTGKWVDPIACAWAACNEAPLPDRLRDSWRSGAMVSEAA